MQSAGHDMNQNMPKYVSNINETDPFIFRMKKCFKMTSFATQKISWDDTELRQLKVHRPANCANCANCAEGWQLRLLLTLPDQVLSTLPNLWMFRAHEFQSRSETFPNGVLISLSWSWSPNWFHWCRPEFHNFTTFTTLSENRPETPSVHASQSYLTRSQEEF